MAHELLKGYAKQFGWVVLAIILSVLVWGVYYHMEFESASQQYFECTCTAGLDIGDANWLCFNFECLDKQQVPVDELEEP